MDALRTESVQELDKNEEEAKKPTLIAFEDDGDVLEEFASDYESQVYRENSVISDQTQKRKMEMREKINEYLKDRKQMGVAKERARMSYDEENQIDGALLDELGLIEGVQRFHQENERMILLFNRNPEHAIAEEIKKGTIASDSPQDIAAYLIKCEGLDKAMLGDYFGKNDEKVLKVLHSYCMLLKFNKVEFDQAIRLLLSRFRLPGEAQQIERIIWEFALAFYESNKEDYDNADELFPLAYAIIMLHTDAHNPKQEAKMTKQDFIKNTQRPCPSIPHDYLAGVYDRITRQKFDTEMSYMETLYNRLKGISSFDIIGALNLAKDLMKGDVFLKICKSTNKFVQRKVSLSEGEDRIEWINDPPNGSHEEPRFILISDVIDLTLGLGSAVMKRNKVPENFDSLCFTIETMHRTLDLKAKTNKERAKWVNYIKAILIRRRNMRKEELQNYHNIHLSRESIQQIWNTEIFPNWDRHWDYKKKKPKEKNLIVRGMEAICCCLSVKRSNDGLESEATTAGLKIKTSLLDTLWKLGLPHNSRKTLWPLVIGNNLALTSNIIEQVKKRKKVNDELRKYQNISREAVQLAEVIRELRPDLPAVRDLLLVSDIFTKAIPNNPYPSFINLIHMHHFMSFYRGEKPEIESRINLFQFLLEKNAPKVRDHFNGLKLETRMYLVSWFLSIFTDCFSQDVKFSLRIWDNFLLEGELYLFKVGMTIIKYYEIQLKMCTFHQGLKLLRFPKNTSEVLFFEILNEEIDVKEEYYHEYVEKRKQAIIKTKVQEIPLE